MSHLAPDRVDEQSAVPMDLSQDGQESVSIFGKVKHKAKKLRDKVKHQYDHRNDAKGEVEEEEEEENEEDEDQSPQKSDENVEGVTQGLAGLSGLGAAKKDDRSKQESEPVNKSTLGDVLNIHEEKTQNPDEVRRKEGILTEAKENPKEDLSYSEKTEQDVGNKGDAIREKEENRTDLVSPSITQKAGVAMAGATGGMLGLGKGNKQEEEPNSSEFTKPPAALQEIPKPLEEEYQNLLETSKAQKEDDGEGNEFSSGEKQTGEDEFGAEKPSGLLQGLKNSFTSDQGKKDAILPEEQSEKDAILPEEQSRGNLDQGKQSEGEDKAGQGYAQKLFGAKNVISSKLGYGGPPSEQKAPVDESIGEDKDGEDKERAPFDESIGEEKVEKYTADESIGEEKMGKYPVDESIGEEKVEKYAADESIGEEKVGKYPVDESIGEEKLEKSAVDESIGEEKLDKSAVDESNGEEKLEKSAFDESKEEEKLKGPQTEEGTENKETKKNTLVSKLSPGEDDKALSEVITGAFNSGAKSIFGGFYGGSPKEEVPPPPSPAKTEVAAELPQNSNPQIPIPPPKGIVGRVTGVVSSFMGKKPKEDVDHASPQTQDPAYGDDKEDLTGSSETQTGNRIEAAAK